MLTPKPGTIVTACKSTGPISVCTLKLPTLLQASWLSTHSDCDVRRPHVVQLPEVLVGNHAGRCTVHKPFFVFVIDAHAQAMSHVVLCSPGPVVRYHRVDPLQVLRDCCVNPFFGRLQSRAQWPSFPQLRQVPAFCRLFPPPPLGRLGDYRVFRASVAAGYIVLVRLHPT